MPMYMEELLKNVPASKTFSITPRQAKKFKENEYYFYFDDAQMNGVDGPATIPSAEPTMTTTTTTKMNYSSDIRFAYPSLLNQGRENHHRQSYADFIANDRNIYLQRKILLQQERLQKHTAETWAAAKNTKKLNTKGLQLEDEMVEEAVKEEDVTKWPQYDYDSIWKLEKYNQKEEIHRESRSNRFWSALFPEQEVNDNTNTATNANANRKRRIFPDPAYILHLTILKVRDERENEAIKLLKEKLASLTVLRKANLRSLVNELFLKALDKGFNDLVQILIESGFPENCNHSIYGDGKSRRFPSYILLAIALGRLKVVQKMLEVQPRAQMNRGWFNGIRPLMMAQMTRKIPGQALLMTQMLLKHGAEPNRSISYSTYLKGFSFINRTRIRTPNNNNIDSKTSRISKPQPKSLRTPRGRREIYRNSRLYALDFAVCREKYESAHLILSAKSSSDWLAKNEFCLLRLEDFEMAADILQRSPELIKQRDPRGNTPLHWVSKLGRTDMVALYLRYTCNVDVLNIKHWTPLHEAAAGAHRATVQYLISRGADCSIKNVEGKTALQVARKNGITSEELYEFFHSADTIQRTQQLIGQLTIPEITITVPAEKGSRLLIQKLMKYPRKLWKRSFKFS